MTGRVPSGLVSLCLKYSLMVMALRIGGDGCGSDGDGDCTELVP